MMADNQLGTQPHGFFHRLTGDVQSGENPAYFPVGSAGKKPYIIPGFSCGKRRFFIQESIDFSHRHVDSSQ